MIEGALTLNDVAEWVRTGGTFGLLILAAKLFNDNRKLKLAERKDDRDGYGDLIDRLTGRVGRLEESEERCRRELQEARGEIAELKGYMTGQGQARQEAAGVVAIERAHGRKDTGK